MTTKLIVASWAAVLVGLAVGGCGSGGAAHSTTAHSTTARSTKPVVRTVSGPGTPAAAFFKPPAGELGSVQIRPFGHVLVDHADDVVYVFERDRRRRVNCTSACQKMWNPVRAPRRSATAVSGLVKRSLLGSSSNPSGGRALTYNGWPLYTYSARTSYGVLIEPAPSTGGQGLDSDGGRWYMISPTGTIITKSGNPGAGVSYPSGIPDE
jgi:predicted lipoprotein with Yx(FWY)xxD motif